MYLGKVKIKKFQIKKNSKRISICWQLIFSVSVYLKFISTSAPFIDDNFFRHIIISWQHILKNIEDIHPFSSQIHCSDKSAGIFNICILYLGLLGFFGLLPILKSRQKFDYDMHMCGSLYLSSFGVARLPASVNAYFSPNLGNLETNISLKFSFFIAHLFREEFNCMCITFNPLGDRVSVYIFFQLFFCLNLNKFH